MPFSGVRESYYLLSVYFSWLKMTEVCYSNYSLMNQLVMHYFNISHGPSWLLVSQSSLLDSVAVVEL